MSRACCSGIVFIIQMNDTEKCPLCGGVTERGICSECGYAVPDSAELEFMTRLAIGEPEEYPCEQLPEKTALYTDAENRQLAEKEICTAEKEYPFADNKQGFLDRIDNFLYDNENAFFWIFAAAVILPSPFTFAVCVIIFALITNNVSFMSEKKLAAAGTVLFLISAAKTGTELRFLFKKFFYL